MPNNEHITFFFTDIEHSTRLAQEFREEYPDLLERYRAVIRQHIAENGGREIDAAGDGLFIIFQDPEKAILTAATIQKEFTISRWSNLAGLKVRMGIHTGAAHSTKSGYTGTEVHLASRICDSAHGGQVLVSQATKRLVNKGFGEDLSLSGLGSFLLKDFDHPVQLFQLIVPGMSEEILKPRIDPVGKRIAVLPLVNLSDDPGQEHFSIGFAEEIMIALGKIQGLNVVSRSSVAALRGERLNALQFGKKLNTTAVLEGTIRKNNGHMRITTELVDTKTGLNIWSGHFDREGENIFQIQDEIAQNIAEVLECELLPQQFDSIQQRQTSSIEAYDFYLRGRRFYSQFSQHGIELALKMFEKAIESDDTYALAYAGISDSYSYLYSHVSRTEENLQNANLASQKAVNLAPMLAEVNVSRGVALLLQNKYEEAEKAFQFSIEHEPGLFLGWFHYGRMCFTLGQLDKAARLFEEANRVQPEDYQSILLAGQVYDDLKCKKLAKFSRQKGIQIARQQLEFNPGDTRALYMAANGLAALGEKEQSMNCLRRALVLEPHDSMLLYNAGCIYALLEMQQEALHCLELAFEQGLTMRSWLENDSNLDSLRDNPRFIALMKKMNTAQ